MSSEKDTRERALDAMVDVLLGSRPERYPLRGGPCDHRSCQRSGTGCRAYADEVVTPTETDIEFGQRLVAEGWWSTSRRYCTVARWREPEPTIEQLFAPGMLDTFHGKRFAEILRKDTQWRMGVRNARPEDLETQEITPAQMLAFKKAGGECGR